MKNSQKFDELRSSLKPVFAVVLAISFFINLLILPVSLYSLQVMDRVLNTGSKETLFWLTVIMLLMFAAAGMLQSLRAIILQKSADYCHEQISSFVLPLVLAQSKAGGKGAQHLRDAGAVKQFIAGNGLVTLIDVPWSLLYIAALFVVHSLLALFVIGGVLALIVLAWLNDAVTKKPALEASGRNMRAMQELELATRNAEVIEAMGMAHNLARRWRAMQNSAVELQDTAGFRASVIHGLTKFARLTLQIIVTCLAAWLAIEGSVTAGAIIAASILASRALAPFEAAIAGWKSSLEAGASYLRLKAAFSDEAAREEGMSMPIPSGELSVENLSYKIDGRDEAVLENVSFKIDAGDVLGIVGASGSGKSSLARLITGIFPASDGVIRLDGADIYRLPRAEFGMYSGYLPQDVELFAGTVKDNIARFSPSATPEAVIKAAQMAGAHDLILRLPKGYDSEIGGGGAFLSAGQRQRIGLARAFYGEPKLLVLDEPDASLDDLGNQALISALHLAKQRKITVVLITHRNLLLKHVDKILVLHEGKVANFGTAKEVIARYAAKA